MSPSVSLFDDLPDPVAEQSPEATTSPYKIQTLPDVQDNIELKDVEVRAPHPMEGKTNTEFGEKFNEALRMSPAMRAHWSPPDIAPVKEHSFGEAVFNSMKRDSFIGNTARWIDQVANESGRDAQEEALIWDNREEILAGISPEQHEYLLGQPTMALALRESERVRNREKAILREMNTGFGKSLTADLMGFVLDPTNLLPGYGMMKGISVAKRMSSLSLLKAATSSKGKAMASLATAGAFEETIRMAPRWQADPTYETNQYVEGIVMSAAFSGLLPVAFGAAGRGASKLPAIHDAIGKVMHQHGIDVGVRQAMRFPGKLKEQGFKDPGTAMRRAKETAQDNVDAKLREINIRTNKTEFDTSMKDGLNETNPSTNKAMDWAMNRIDNFADVAESRIKIRVERAATAAGLTTAATIAGGPVAGLATAALYANREYMAIAARYALRGIKNADAKAIAKQQRRVAYDAAITAGDEKGAAKILRTYKSAETPEITIEQAKVQIREAANDAKAKLREINQRNEVCI